MTYSYAAKYMHCIAMHAWWIGVAGKYRIVSVIVSVLTKYWCRGWAFPARSSVTTALRFGYDFDVDDLFNIPQKYHFW
jgi:hypothetical protein